MLKPTFERIIPSYFSVRLINCIIASPSGKLTFKKMTFFYDIYDCLGSEFSLSRLLRCMYFSDWMIEMFIEFYGHIQI